MSDELRKAAAQANALVDQRLAESVDVLSALEIDCPDVAVAFRYLMQHGHEAVVAALCDPSTPLRDEMLYVLVGMGKLGYCSVLVSRGNRHMEAAG